MSLQFLLSGLILSTTWRHHDEWFIVSRVFIGLEVWCLSATKLLGYGWIVSISYTRRNWESLPILLCLKCFLHALNDLLFLSPLRPFRMCWETLLESLLILISLLYLFSQALLTLGTCLFQSSLLKDWHIQSTLGQHWFPRRRHNLLNCIWSLDRSDYRRLNFFCLLYSRQVLSLRFPSTDFSTIHLFFMSAVGLI